MGKELEKKGTEILLESEKKRERPVKDCSSLTKRWTGQCPQTSSRSGEGIEAQDLERILLKPEGPHTEQPSGP